MIPCLCSVTGYLIYTYYNPHCILLAVSITLKDLYGRWKNLDPADYPAIVLYAVMLVVYLLLAGSGVRHSVLLVQGPHQSIQVCVVWVVYVCMCAFQNLNVYVYKCVCVLLPAASAVCMNALCLRLSITIQSCHQPLADPSSQHVLNIPVDTPFAPCSVYWAVVMFVNKDLLFFNSLF